MGICAQKRAKPRRIKNLCTTDDVRGNPANGLAFFYFPLLVLFLILWYNIRKRFTARRQRTNFTKRSKHDRRKKIKKRNRRRKKGGKTDVNRTGNSSAQGL